MMISMGWENTLLASRILPPAYMPVDVAANRSQDASLMLEQGTTTFCSIWSRPSTSAILITFLVSCFGRLLAEY